MLPSKTPYQSGLQNVAKVPMVIKCHGPRETASLGMEVWIGDQNKILESQQMTLTTHGVAEEVGVVEAAPGVEGVPVEVLVVVEAEAEVEVEVKVEVGAEAVRLEAGVVRPVENLPSERQQEEEGHGRAKVKEKTQGQDHNSVS